jgi:hypothetical protein
MSVNPNDTWSITGESWCTEERVCVNCYLDQGDCLDTPNEEV